MSAAATKLSAEESAKITAGRWRYAVCAFLIQIVVTIVYSWSVFRVPLGILHGWNKSQTIAPNRYTFLFVAVGAVAGGLLGNRRGPRLVATLGGTLLAIGCIISAYSGDSLNLLIMGYGVIGGFGGGAAYVTPIANLVKWFPDKRGRMVGLSVMGSGMSSSFWSPLIEKLIGPDKAAYHDTVPYTFFVMAAITFAVIVGLAQFFRDPPAGWVPEGWTPPEATAGHPHASMTQMLNTWQFYLMWAVLFLGTSTGSTAIGQAAPLIQEVAGKNIPFAIGWAVAIMGFSNALGRLSWGWVSDHIGRKTAMYSQVVISIVACLGFLRSASGFETALAGLCLAAFAYGGYMAVMPSLCADYFGSSHVAGNYGLIFSAWGICGFAVPYYSEGLLDRAREAGNLMGGYKDLYLQLAVLAVIVAVLVTGLRRPNLQFQES